MKIIIIYPSIILIFLTLVNAGPMNSPRTIHPLEVQDISLVPEIDDLDDAALYQILKSLSDDETSFERFGATYKRASLLKIRFQNDVHLLRMVNPLNTVGSRCRNNDMMKLIHRISLFKGVLAKSVSSETLFGMAVDWYHSIGSVIIRCMSFTINQQILNLFLDTMEKSLNTIPDLVGYAKDGYISKDDEFPVSQLGWISSALISPDDRLKRLDMILKLVELVQINDLLRSLTSENVKTGNHLIQINDIYKRINIVTLFQGLDISVENVVGASLEYPRISKLLFLNSDTLNTRFLAHISSEVPSNDQVNELLKLSQLDLLTNKYFTLKEFVAKITAHNLIFENSSECSLFVNAVSALAIHFARGIEYLRTTETNSAEIWALQDYLQTTIILLLKKIRIAILNLELPTKPVAIPGSEWTFCLDHLIRVSRSNDLLTLALKSGKLKNVYLSLKQTIETKTIYTN